MAAPFDLDDEGPLSPFELQSDLGAEAGYWSEYELFDHEDVDDKDAAYDEVGELGFEDDEEEEEGDFELPYDEYRNEGEDDEYDVEHEGGDDYEGGADGYDPELEEDDTKPPYDADWLAAESGDLLDAEAEAFLGHLWNSTKTVWEKALVGTAVARGERNVQRLTDLVFCRRHPNRRGRPLKRSETKLINEWLAIRDDIVHPVLASTRSKRSRPPARRSHPRLQRSPGRSRTGGPTNWAQVRSDLVAVTNQELSYWRHGGLSERHPAGWKKIEQYWRESLGWYPKNRKTGVVRRGVNLARNEAWSAVFISWCVNEAGVDKNLFKRRGNHANYMVDLLRAEAENPGHPITIVDPYSVPLRKGDMVNNWRTWKPKGKRVRGGPFTLADLRQFARDEGKKMPGWPSHTDIVVDIKPGRCVVLAGGNKDNTAKTVEEPIDANDILRPRPYRGRANRAATGKDTWTAIIRMGP